VSAREASLGGLSLTAPSSVRSLPAALLAAPVRTRLQVSWCNPYAVPGLQLSELFICTARSGLVLAVQVGRLTAPAGYGEVRAEAGFALRAAETVSFGASYRRALLLAGGDSSVGASSAGVGVAVRLRELVASCFVLAALGERRSEGSFRWEVAVPIAEDATIVAGERRDAVCARHSIAAELKPASALAVRVGVSDGPETATAGVTIPLSRLVLEAALVQHDQLGVTPHVTLSFKQEPAPE